MSDPQLKFATGVQKGKLLDSAGVPYRIIERAGEQVALFRNGAMARFYREETLPDNIEDAINPVADAEFVRNMPGPVPDAPAPQKVEGPILRSSRPRMTISAYREKDESRPRHLCEPVYCILEDGRSIYTVSRAETGTGLREYLWIYEKLREFRRRRFAALWEAWEIYFL